MEIIRSSAFRRAYGKLEWHQQEQVDYALDIFEMNPLDPRLRNHKLIGPKKGVRSFSAGYDLRILYLDQGGHMIVFLLKVGTHDEVY